MIAILYIILLLFLGFDILIDKKILSPIKVFNSIWLLTIFLYNLKFSYLQQDLSNRTILIFILIVLFYNLGFIIFYYIFNKKHSFKKIYTPKKSIDKRVDIAFLIFIITSIAEMIYCKGFPVLFLLTNGKSNYLHYGLPSLHGALNGIAMVLGTYFLFKKDNRKYIILLIEILLLSRQVLMTIVIQAIFYNIGKFKKINIKKYLVILISCMLLFGIVGNFRSGDDTMKSVFDPKPQYSNMPSTFMWVYSYATFSISNFNNLVSITDGGINNGVTTLNYFLPTVIQKKFNIVEKHSIKYLVKSNFTVSTAFSQIYIDFSILGEIIFILIVIFLGSNFYHRLIYYNDEESKMLYSIFLHNIVFIFFNNMFIYTPVFFELFYAVLIFRKEKKNE